MPDRLCALVPAGLLNAPLAVNRLVRSSIRCRFQAVTKLSTTARTSSVRLDVASPAFEAPSAGNAKLVAMSNNRWAARIPSLVGPTP